VVSNDVTLSCLLTPVTSSHRVLIRQEKKKLSHLDIDGALVGGASFEARSFDQIVPAARLTSKTAIREDAIWSRPAM
jgi:hypothetical protein